MIIRIGDAPDLDAIQVTVTEGDLARLRGKVVFAWFCGPCIGFGVGAAFFTFLLRTIG